MFSNEGRLIEINSEERMIRHVIKKIQYILQNTVYLNYLNAESALKLVHNELLQIEFTILEDKNKIMLEISRELEKRIS